MLFNGIHLARCIGVEVLAHVRCCPAHDLLDGKVCHQAVAQLMDELMEPRFRVEHGGLLVEELQHIPLQL